MLNLNSSFFDGLIKFNGLFNECERQAETPEGSVQFEDPLFTFSGEKLAEDEPLGQASAESEHYNTSQL